MPTFETPEPISVTVELGVGDIRVVASDRTDTVVDVRPSDPAKKSDVKAAEQTRVDYVAGRLLIKSPKGWRQWSFRGGESIDLEIGLPAGSDVGVVGGVAALRCSGRVGECRFRLGVGDIQLDQAGPLDLKTGAGDIMVDQAVGEVEVSTGSGAVQIASIDGSAVVKNANGDTSIGEVSGDVRVNAANGRISIDVAHAAVAAKTANGDVRVGEIMRGTTQAESGFGKVEVGIRDGVAAWLDLSTGFGNVVNELDSTRRPELGEDSVDVRARTSYGDITIHRSLASDIGKDEA